MDIMSVNSIAEYATVPMIPTFIDLLARRFRIPPLAVQMFRASTELSGLDRKTLPVELLPLNTIQIGRGLLNFTVLQTLDRWVLPFWAEQQYDPRSPSFVPRAHLGLSMNVTHRNWTAAGNPECSIEPIVDPRGLITPFPDGWSIDLWLNVGGAKSFPSRLTAVRQHLVQGLPIVVTEWQWRDLGVRSVVRTHGRHMAVDLRVDNASADRCDVCVGIAVRPFNPEGVGFIRSIAVTGEDRITINGNATVSVSEVPHAVAFSTLADGDVAGRFGSRRTDDPARSVACDAGLATGVLEYHLSLNTGGRWECLLTCPLESGDACAAVPGLQASITGWDTLLAEGSALHLPEHMPGDLFRASRSALLASVDGTTIRPGPATYHHFWFRDAAYMLVALDRIGHCRLTAPVVRAFTEHQERDGMFRSQQGEWDSTGQAVWTIWHHAVLAQDRALLEEHFGPMQRAVRWMDRKLERGDGPLFEGLMPAGLSAEHLGLADVYYWDAFWTLAGFEAFERVCLALGRHPDARRAGTMALRLRTHLETSIAHAMGRQGIDHVPPGPVRTTDAGIIGSVAAWYPLQLFPPEDPRLQATVRMIVDTMFMDGMFYQPFVHSGLNAYLTLHVAECLLHTGDAEAFWKILTDVERHATPTYTFPEAIHPQTGGGCMGDGHHAWVAAEVVLALRHAFVREVWDDGTTDHTLCLLGGIPHTVFERPGRFGIERVPVPGGMLSVSVVVGRDLVEVGILAEHTGILPPGRMVLSLPDRWELVDADGTSTGIAGRRKGRIIVPLPPGVRRVRAYRTR